MRCGRRACTRVRPGGVGPEARVWGQAFCRMRPGVPLAVLHGKMKPARRQVRPRAPVRRGVPRRHACVQLTFADFIKRRAAVLIATDIAARGLDVPEVDWVRESDRGVRFDFLKNVISLH